MNLSRFLIFTACSAAITSPLVAQIVGGDFVELHRMSGDSPYIRLGSAVTGVGDVNGDGFDDVLVSANYDDFGGLQDRGSVSVLSGANWQVLYHFTGLAAHDLFGSAVASAGDVDGDGVDDILIGAYAANPLGIANAGSVYVYSGVSGNLIRQFDGDAPNQWFGSSLASAGDLDQDGLDDILIGATGASPMGITRAGSVFAYSGATGALLFRFDGDYPGTEFGTSVANAGDTNHDGYPDILVGAPLDSTTAFGLNAGSASLFSGADGQKMAFFNDSRMFYHFGHAIAGVGDLDGDSFDDIIISAIGYITPNWWEDIEGAGALFLYSGRTHEELYRIEGMLEGGQLGISLATAGDVDGDGVADFMAGRPGYYPAVRIFSGANLQELLILYGSQFFGSSIGAAGDVNGDGFSDVIVGDTYASPGGFTRAGAARVYGVDPYLTTDRREVSLSTGGQVSLALDFPLEAASMKYRVLFSEAGTTPFLQGVSIPLTYTPLVEQTARGQYPFPQSQGLQGTLNANGQAAASFSIPAGAPPALLGRRLWFAAVAMEPNRYPSYSSMASWIEMTP